METKLILCYTVVVWTNKHNIIYTIILHADLVSYSSFMELERDMYMWVGTCVYNLYQALFWPSPLPNFESLGMRLDSTTVGGLPSHLAFKQLLQQLSSQLWAQNARMILHRLSTLPLEPNELYSL